LNAISVVLSAAAPTLRAAAPALRPRHIKWTSGWSDSTADGVPSVDPLSTTQTWGRSGKVARRASVSTSWAQRLRVAITIPTSECTDISRQP
jgi:hypothetical protein